MRKKIKYSFREFTVVLIAATIVYTLDYFALRPLGMIPTIEFLIDVVVFYFVFKTLRMELGN
tara:strand:+ start:215 stop:400 length:186 start_codon:yes stop_codon:yes gene_type:complete